MRSRMLQTKVAVEKAIAKKVSRKSARRPEIVLRAYLLKEMPARRRK